MAQLNSLDLAKPVSATRCVVAMSGGVDSSVVAGVLKRQGYEVIGITLQLYDHGAAVARRGACCAGRDIHDARRVAETLGIPHYVLDYESRFRDAVVEEFADAYLTGATPVPCIRCNERVKFRDLLSLARDLDADCLATGHYVRRALGAGGVELHAAADSARDQSYFLFTTTRDQLEYLRFPLGGVGSKAETRAMAAELGLAIAAKPDSQDICFVPDGDYAAVVARLRPGMVRPGEIVDEAGTVLGRHEGVIHYTVGQRRGLGLGGGAPLHVLRLEAETARVVVGPRARLATRTFALSGVNWLGDGAWDAAPGEGWEVRVRVRSTRPPTPALVRPQGAGAEVTLLAPEEGVAPGQACVFYAPEGSRCLGGGWIAARAA